MFTNMDLLSPVLIWLITKVHTFEPKQPWAMPCMAVETAASHETSGELECSVCSPACVSLRERMSHSASLWDMRAALGLCNYWR